MDEINSAFENDLENFGELNEEDIENFLVSAQNEDTGPIDFNPSPKAKTPTKKSDSLSSHFFLIC